MSDEQTNDRQTTDGDKADDDRAILDGKKEQEEAKDKTFEELLGSKQYTQVPKAGDLVKGRIISVAKSEVRVDIAGYRAGIVRGREICDESKEAADLKVGDEVEATVLELENEKGEVELSLRHAGHQKAWDHLKSLKDSGEVISVPVSDANRGGLMVKIGQVQGFLPVSQLAPEHYPRVPGGDRGKILEKLKSYVGEKMEVRVITAEEQEDKLIVSEKAALADKQQKVVAAYKEGDVVEGVITAVTDFGAFINFGEHVEGLIHISELAWQRIDHPRDVIKNGDKVKAKIINIREGKIFLSVKALQADPWAQVNDKYKLGQVVEGKVLKANPFGLFVELDSDIHGLAHISELSHRQVRNPNDIAKPGEILKLKIISIDPVHHRLGLSLRAMEDAAGTAAREEPFVQKEAAILPAAKQPAASAQDAASDEEKKTTAA